MRLNVDDPRSKYHLFQIILFIPIASQTNYSQFFVSEASPFIFSFLSNSHRSFFPSSFPHQLILINRYLDLESLLIAAIFVSRRRCNFITILSVHVTRAHVLLPVIRVKGLALGGPLITNSLHHDSY